MQLPDITTAYRLAKALHIIGFTCWFAGLFYIVRLFIYHSEAGNRPAAERSILWPQLELMQQRLWRIITRPAMVVTLVFGLWLAEITRAWQQPWFWLKLGLLGGLYAYHHLCGRILQQQCAHTSRWTPLRLRYLNEAATLFLVSIVFTAIFKHAIFAPSTLLGMLLFAATLAVGVHLYFKRRPTQPPSS